jgi:outer membrane protein assembly factor BamD (BamD/ComL family)
MSLLRHSAAVAVLLLAPTLVLAQKNKDRAGYDRAARATLLYTANVYTEADANTSPLANVTPGHEVIVVQRSAPWIKVFANTDTKDQTDPDETPDFAEDATITPSSGWIRDKGVVTPATPNGDSILFGAAATFEDQAEQPHAPKGAAAAAHLLYRRVFEYFPDSPLAAEAAYHSADIRWQLDKIDISTLPSAKEQEAYLRPQLYEGDLKKVMKTYPGTKFAGMAAYDLIDNKLCGDWQGLPKCPEMETGLYVKYAQQFPDSPKAPEALYNAVYRQAVLVTMYTVQEDRKRSENAARQSQALAADMKQRFPQSEFTARGAAIAYKVQQNIAVNGDDRD